MTMRSLFNRYKEEIIVSSIFMFFALGFNVYRVQSDGVYYYAILEGILHLPGSLSAHIHGFHQAGCVFFNLPFYLAAYFTELFLKVSLHSNGITLRQVSINLASNFYMLMSILMTIRILKSLKLKSILLPVISILFSTSAFSVSVLMPSFTHAVDIFVNTLIVYFILKSNKSERSAFWLGMIYVVSILVRYANFVFAFPLLLYFIFCGEWKKMKFFSLGLLSSGWIIALVFYFYNGNAFLPYDINSSGTVQTIVNLPHWPRFLLNTLFNPVHGLFIWSPVTIISILGLAVMPKEIKKTGYLFLGLWLAIVIFYGYMYFWSAGWSFSNRLLSGLFAIYVIGLSAVIERYGRKIACLVILLTFYSIILYLNWQLCIFNAEFGTPGDMVTAWIKGESATSMDKVVNIKTFLQRLWVMCRYKYILRFMR
ncbi:MAG: hypothetical protein NTU54_00830 [Candidatus Omnitrophica bacterium]|nr:hypothetical protein [Candidatus Omnitrophota bacterium]